MIPSKPQPQDEGDDAQSDVDAESKGKGKATGLKGNSKGKRKATAPAQEDDEEVEGEGLEPRKIEQVCSCHTRPILALTAQSQSKVPAAPADVPPSGRMDFLRSLAEDNEYLAFLDAIPTVVSTAPLY